MDSPTDLSRYEAHLSEFHRALGEIESGRKQSHWMWWVFPQVAGLGITQTSRTYAIGSVAEAQAFLLHPALGEAYRQIVAAVWHQVVEAGVTVRALFGSPDDLKLVSSLTCSRPPPSSFRIQLPTSSPLPARPTTSSGSRINRDSRGAPRPSGS